MAKHSSEIELDPVLELQPSGRVAHPLPGFGPEELGELDPRDDLDDLDPRTKDDTNSVFNPNNRGAVEQFGRNINVGLAEHVFGAPVDLMNFLLGLTGDVAQDIGKRLAEEEGKLAPEFGPVFEASQDPFAGAKSFQRLFEQFGIAPLSGEEEEQKETISGKIAEFVAFGAGLLLPFAGPLKTATKIEKGIRPRPTTIAGGALYDLAQTAIKRPATFVAADVAANIAAGTGEFVAAQLFPGSLAAEGVGALAGGLTPLAAVKTVEFSLTNAVTRFVGRQILKFGKAITPAGGKIRARKRFTTAARSQEQALEKLAAKETRLEEAELTIAQQTGDEGLLALEKSIIDSSQQLRAKADEQITKATEVIRASLEVLGEEVPVEAAQNFLKAARDDLLALLAVRVKIAGQLADEKIAALAPGATRDEANRIVGDEIEDVMKAANDQIDELFAAVPLEVKVSVKGPKKDFAKLLKKTPLAQRKDIPTIAARLLGKEEGDAFEAQFAESLATQPGLKGADEVLGRLKDIEPVSQLQGLRSTLMEEARLLRAAGRGNAARLAGEIAESVLKAMGAGRDEVTGPAGESLRTALDFTKAVKETFNRGIVRKLLKPDRQGGETIPTALTLEKTIRKGGPEAKVEFDALTAAVRTEDIEGIVLGDEPKLRKAVGDFLLNIFRRDAVVEGRIDETAATAFLKRHEEMLDELPALRKQITNAIEADQASLLIQGEVGVASKELLARTSVFLKEPVELGIQRVVKSPHPTEAMIELMATANQDPTGKALKGLKTAFGEFLLEKSSTTITTKTGEFTIAGRALKRLLEKGKTSRAAKALFNTPEEQTRLAQIAETAIQVELALKATRSEEGIISDAPSMMFYMLAGIGGAKAGRSLNTGTIQAPGYVAKWVRAKLKKFTQDPAKRIIIESMDDENLFLALNTPVKTSERPPKFIMQQLNAFVAKGLQEVGEEIEVPFPEAGLPAEEDLAEAPEADETATALLETPPSEAAPEVIEGGAGEALEEKPIEAAPDLEGEIEQTIRSDEGSDLTVRKDGKSGKLVVGTGHQVAPADNLKEGDTISKERAEGLLQTDLSQAKTEAETILNTLGEQPPELTGLITEMTFQLGLEGTQKFQKFLDALRRQDYEAAADEIVDSKLFREDSPERAQRLADRVRALAQPQSP